MEAMAGDSKESIADRTALDERFVARQKGRLEEARRMLLREIEDVDEDEREWNKERRDAPEFASYVSARELDVLLERKLRHRLAFVERALEKIGEGTYGVCDATGRPIPRGRLEAIPEAIYTLEALKSQGANAGPLARRRDPKAGGGGR